MWPRCSLGSIVSGFQASNDELRGTAVVLARWRESCFGHLRLFGRQLGARRNRADDQLVRRAGTFLFGAAIRMLDPSARQDGSRSWSLGFDR